MKALPWILVLIFLAAAGYFFNGEKKSKAELAQLRQETEELQSLRAEVEELKKISSQNSESLAEKEKAELIRLRNEVGVLRRDKQQLAAQAQKAQENTERLQQAQEAQQAQQAQRTQQLQQKNQQLAQQTEFEKAKNACINNLRQIDGAKQQWALENKQTAEAIPTAQHIAPYLPNQTVPVCPSSGVYTLGNLESFPTCSIPGHALSQ
jgi:hypothetical protein